MQRFGPPWKSFLHHHHHHQCQILNSVLLSSSTRSSEPMPVSTSVWDSMQLCDLDLQEWFFHDISNAQHELMSWYQCAVPASWKIVDENVWDFELCFNPKLSPKLDAYYYLNICFATKKKGLSGGIHMMNGHHNYHMRQLKTSQFQYLSSCVNNKGKRQKVK